MAEWPPIGKMAAHWAYNMFSLYKYLIVNLVFPHLGFWSGNFFLILPFPDRCLLLLNVQLILNNTQVNSTQWHLNNEKKATKAGSNRNRITCRSNDLLSIKMWKQLPGTGAIKTKGRH